MFLEIIFLTNSFSLSVNSGAIPSGGIRFSTNLTRKKKEIKEKEKLQGKKVLMYCAVGHRSTLAVQVSKSYGYQNCYHLMGGIKNWIAQNNPIKKKEHC